MHKRAWRRAQRALHPLPVAPFLEKVNRVRLEEIHRSYCDSGDPYAKYSDWEGWLQLNVRRAQDCGLHRSSGKRVLDLGCGGGYFLFVAQQLGHSCLGLDVDTCGLFNELIDLFAVRRKVWNIRAFEPLPELGEQFDLITAFAVNFNVNENGLEWGPKEWDFFLDDLGRFLQPRGKMLFNLNRDKNGLYYTPALEAFFRQRHASVERENVMFRSATTT